MKKVSIRLLWVHQAQFSGIYAAKYFGAFAERGLLVTIIPANPDQDSPSVDRFGGESQFAIVSSTDIVKSRDRGINLRALMVIVPEPAIVLMAKQSSDISTVSDFRNKNISVRVDYEEGSILAIMLHQNGMTMSDVVCEKGGLNYEGFEDGRIDIIGGHTAAEVIKYAFEKTYVRTFPPMQNGRPIFADTLATNEFTIKSMPSVVRSMTAAVEAGWEFVTDNTDAGVECACFMMSDYSDKNIKFQNAMLNHIIDMRAGIRDSEKNSLKSAFGLRDDDWKPIITAMKNAGLIRSLIRPSDLYWK